VATSKVDFGNKRQVRRAVRSLDRELNRVKLLKIRFQQKHEQVPKQVRDRYAGESAATLISKTSDTALIRHARNLGFNAKITDDYTAPGLKPRSLIRQASDYIRMWLEFDKHMNLMIENSLIPKKDISREKEYDYYEHLSQ